MGGVCSLSEVAGKNPVLKSKAISETVIGNMHSLELSPEDTVS